MRLFVAIEIPKVVRSTLADLQRKLKPRCPGVRWVEEHLLHITLRFLGEVNENHFGKVVSAAQEVANHWTEPPILRVENIGTFSSQQRVHVVWIGLGRGEKELSVLTKELQRNLLDQGFPRERRRWSAHVTLGRSRQGFLVRNSADISSIADNVSGPRTWSANEFVAMQSSLSAQGPTYTCLKRFSLGKD